MERFKEEIKTLKQEKYKLEQYKQNKAKRLDDLESKARDFEVMGNINLNKMLGMIEKKDKELSQLRNVENAFSAQQRSVETVNKLKYSDMKKRFETESKLKTDAMEKLDGLRNELALIEGGDYRNQAEIWKDKCR